MKRWRMSVQVPVLITILATAAPIPTIPASSQRNIEGVQREMVMDALAQLEQDAERTNLSDHCPSFPLAEGEEDIVTAGVEVDIKDNTFSAGGICLSQVPEVEWSSRGFARSVGGLGLRISLGQECRTLSPDDAAFRFLERYALLFGIRDVRTELSLSAVRERWKSGYDVMFRQFYGDLPVFGPGLVVHLSEENELMGIGGFYVPNIKVARDHILTSAEAEHAVVQAAHDAVSEMEGWIDGIVLAENPRLGIVDPELFTGKPNEPRLVWELSVLTEGSGTSSRYLVDAVDGTIVNMSHSSNQKSSWDVEMREGENTETRKRTILSWMNGDDWDSMEVVCLNEGLCCNHPLPGQRAPDDAPLGNNSDCSLIGWPEEATESWEHLTAVYDYYRDNFSREGWDGSGKVRIQCEFNPEGESSGLFCKAIPYPLVEIGFVGIGAACLDYIADAYTWLVRMNEPNLHDPPEDLYGPYRHTFAHGMPLVGSQFVESWWYGETDWKFGTCTDPWEDCLNPPEGRCFCERDLRDPSSLDEEDLSHLNNFSSTIPQEHHPPNPWDVEHTATIIGKAFSLLASASKGEEFMGVEVEGIGCDKADDIWYGSLMSLDTNPDFTELRWAMLQSALRLYGHGSEFVQTVNAVDAIGVWTGDAEMCGTKVGSSVSAVSFTVKGDDLRHLFYRDDVRWMVGCRRKKLPFEYGSCGYWREESEPPEIPRMRTDRSPTALVYDDKLWVFYKGVFTDMVYYRWMSHDGKWSSLGIVCDLETEDSPAAAVLGDRIYVFLKEKATGEIYYCRYEPDSHWHSPVSAGFNAPNVPGVAAPFADMLRERLFLFYGDDTDTLRYRYMTDNEVISVEKTVPGGVITRGSPAVAVFRNRVHVVTRDDSQNPTDLCYISLGTNYDEENARGWSRKTSLAHGVGGEISLFSDPGLTEDLDDDRLFLFQSEPATHLLFSRSKRSK